MSDGARNKWNKIYATQNLLQRKLEESPALVLQQNAFLLPNTGSALDLACGIGSNAIFLAKSGLNTSAWDISAIAIESLQSYSQENNLGITAEARDVEQQPPAVNSYDVICVSYFLERSLAIDIINALKPNGLLFYQTFIEEKVTDAGPSNPEYRLQENELLTLFSPLHILSYQEHGKVGDIKKGFRDAAMLVAQKR